MTPRHELRSKEREWREYCADEPMTARIYNFPTKHSGPTWRFPWELWALTAILGVALVCALIK